ncbi:MAG: DUF1015 domain-containing protein [Candidatus Omnitrophota bacterium]
MTEIRPFRGLLYDKSKAGGDYASVMAPPYDVISKNMQDELYEKNAHNIIRLILGKDIGGDTPENNKYTRARRFLDEWQREGALRRDDTDSFYIYLQEYGYKGEKHRRIGFIGIIKIGETGKDTVLPHEHTLAKPKEDRMNLIKQVQSNLSPIFTLYDDKDGIVRSILEGSAGTVSPLIDIDVDGEKHKLWRLSDKESIEGITSRMADKKVFIADGHHRYEVARAYRDMRRQQDGYDGSADYIMMYFTDTGEDNDLTVMATHRVVRVMPRVDDGEVIGRLGEYFDVTECGELSGLMERLDKGYAEEHAFGFFDGKNYIFMKPKDKNSLRGFVKEDKTEQWKQLDVSVLHSVVLDDILSVTSSEGNITYVREPEKAEALVRDGSHMAAFFLNPTRVGQLKAVAECGEMMPQKSTYFYPKLLSGLVIHRFGA